MASNMPAIHVSETDAAVTKMFSERDLISAPVIHDDGLLVGRTTIDDVVDVIIEDAEEAVLARAGLDVHEEEDTFAPVHKAVRRRAVWLGINLLTALMAAGAIHLFEEAIVKVVALAVLMPVVASMGGIAGTQPLTLVIREQVAGQIGKNNLLWILSREFIVTALNGMLWATLVGVAAAVVFSDPLLGYVIAAAMMMTILVAAVAGSLLPSLLRRMNIHPAIAGGVVLTTITDIAGFFVFLGLATLVYV